MMEINAAIQNSPIQWVVAIVDRGKGERVTEIYQKNGVRVHLVALGQGTAKEDIMDFLGLDEPLKDVVFSMVPRHLVEPVMQKLKEKMQLDRPGKGVVFSVALSGITAATVRQVEAGSVQIKIDKEVPAVAGQIKNELIVTIVERGQADIVMEAAKAKGATGGTVVHARGTGTEEVKRFFGITIQPEKEMILIVAKEEQKHDIMKAVSAGMLKETGNSGFAFSLPISTVIGLESDVEHI